MKASYDLTITEEERRELVSAVGHRLQQLHSVKKISPTAQELITPLTQLKLRLDGLTW